MQKVRIVTDGTSDVPKELAKELGIRVVPAYVQFGEKTYRTGIDMTQDEFFARLTTEKVLPKSSAPTPADMLSAYRETLDSGATSIISIQPSAQLSTTYQAACSARDSLKGSQIDVFDTRQVSMGQGLIAVEAARAAIRGLSHSEIVNLVKELTLRAKFMMSLDTFDFIMRSGKIGRATGMMAAALSVKPILTVSNGLIVSFDRVRGADKVLPRLVEICQDAVKDGQRIRTSVVHAHALSNALALKSEIQKKIDSGVLLADAGTSISTNVGPGAYGVAYVELPKGHPIP